MNNQDTDNNDSRPTRNIWNLVLGIAFLSYGSFRLYQKTNAAESDTFGIVLAIAFIIFGIYDLYKYFRRP